MPGELDDLMEPVPFYRRAVMRRGAIRGLDADVPQAAVVNVLATHARMPEATVREAVAAFIASGDELGRLNPLFAGMTTCSSRCARRGAWRSNSAACRCIPARCTRIATPGC